MLWGAVAFGKAPADLPPLSNPASPAGWRVCHRPSSVSSCNIYSRLSLTSIVLGQEGFGNWAYKWKELNALLLSSLLAT